MSGDKTHPGWGDLDCWMVKIDSLGSKQWDKPYGGTGDDGMSALIQAKDGGYVLLGHSGSPISGNKTAERGGYWVVKTDSSGNKQWDKGFDGTGGGGTEPLTVFQTADGGYLLSGITDRDSGADKSESNFEFATNNPLNQGWIVKIDSLGNKQWDKTIFLYGNSGAYAIQTRDGCYAIANTTDAQIGGYKTQSPWDSTNDYWIVKFCDTLINSVTDITERDKVQLSIYPNPFATDIAIAIQKENLRAATFTITNPLGQIIYTQQETNLSPAYTKMLDLRYLPNGVYFVSVVVDGERVVREVVKE